jgi:hypothetical protein
MSDQCVYCTLRGKSVEECRNIECYKLDDWITQSLSTDLEAAKAENAIFNKTLELMEKDSCLFQGPGHPMEIIESFKDRATAIIVEGETK